MAQSEDNFGEMLQRWSVSDVPAVALLIEEAYKDLRTKNPEINDTTRLWDAFNKGKLKELNNAVADLLPQPSSDDPSDRLRVQGTYHGPEGKDTYLVLSNGYADDDAKKKTFLVTTTELANGTAPEKEAFIPATVRKEYSTDAEKFDFDKAKTYPTLEAAFAATTTEQHPPSDAHSSTPTSPSTDAPSSPSPAPSTGSKPPVIDPRIANLTEEMDDGKTKEVAEAIEHEPLQQQMTDMKLMEEVNKTWLSQGKTTHTLEIHPYAPDGMEMVRDRHGSWDDVAKDDKLGLTAFNGRIGTHTDEQGKLDVFCDLTHEDLPLPEHSPHANAKLVIVALTNLEGIQNATPAEKLAEEKKFEQSDQPPHSIKEFTDANQQMLHILLGSKTPSEIQVLDQAFRELRGMSIEEYIKQNTSGENQRQALELLHSKN